MFLKSGAGAARSRPHSRAAGNSLVPAPPDAAAAKSFMNLSTSSARDGSSSSSPGPPPSPPPSKLCMYLRAPPPNAGV
eukprot:2697668-Prymnesium_polylepis.1